MNELDQFVLDLVDDFSTFQIDGDRWEFTLNRLAELGINALNMLCFTPKTGQIHWVRSSMTKPWLEQYERGGYAEADPMLAQVYNGTESLYVQAASLRAEDGHSELTVRLNYGLNEAGYIHLFSLIVPCPDNEAKLVVLASDRPEMHEVMTGQDRSMRILATILATNLGAETPDDHGRVYDIASLVDRELELTPRETEVLTLLAEGFRNERIADTLNLSEVTIRAHLQSARQKLQAPTRESALVRAMQLGLISPTPYRKR
ncbi:LuxR C-terminal-related transcriptional regulator [uncultured Ruegeria sp.]|uniref:helix-turn-helix transcriptional regulator n=1 Tax=uncultured Ruegeria sp. TaxID=259304 RepID=UPI00260406E0|nr:LuxR C-terminal-related transcriptional regulator [uncultured Ruegeria sp.]